MLPPPQVLPPEAPRLENDRYVILARVGRGGMAGVYAAWDCHAQEWRAIKLLLPRHARDKGVRGRFQKEGAMMAQLNHPNLVRVFETGSATFGGVELPFISMELLNGGSLHRWVKQHGAMPPRLALAAGIQLCQGLEHVHAAGVIHRDVKPKNVLADDDSILKLTDFGIAQIDSAGGETKTGLAMGTLGYMAPEQLHDAKSVDVKSDLYALGATLWTMLTTQKPRDLFRLEDRPDLLEVVPDPIRPILIRCLAYERADRPESARAVADELRSILFQLPEDPPDTPDLSMHLALPDHTSVTADSFKELAIEGKSTGDTTGHTGASRGDSSFPAQPNPPGGRRLGPPIGSKKPALPGNNASFRAGRTGSTLAPADVSVERPGPEAPRPPAPSRDAETAARPQAASYGGSYADFRRESDARGEQPAYVVAEEQREEPLKPPPPPKPPPPGRSWLGTALVAAPTLLAALAGIPIVLGIGVLGYAATGSSRVSAAQAAFEKASANLDRNVSYLDTLPEEVGALGVDTTELRAAYETWDQAAPGYDRTALAVKYVSQAEKLARPNLPDKDRNHEQELVFQRLERVEKVLVATLQTRDEWEDASETTAGGLAVLIGLASAPP